MTASDSPTGRPPALPGALATPLHVLGVMSGTSLDGVDAALVRFESAAEPDAPPAWEIVARAAIPYASELRERLRACLDPAASDVVEITQLHAEVGRAYADLVERVAGEQRVDLVALSGQTVWHIPRPDPARGWRTPSTLQLGEASVAAERCGVPVWSDFRQGDMAAGGEGAPMVAFADRRLFTLPDRARSVHNLGGISNLTWLPPAGSEREPFAFDTGPASCLVDEAAERCFGIPFDDGGARAARGEVDAAALAALLEHPYLDLPPPKTTGREVFALREIERSVPLEHLGPHDLLATLTAFTAESVARAYREHVPGDVSEVLVAGGGALNEHLMARLRAALPAPVRTFEDLGLQAKDRETLAFALMGWCAERGEPNTLPSATGARRAVVAGKRCDPRARG